MANFEFKMLDYFWFTLSDIKYLYDVRVGKIMRVFAK